MGFHFGLGDFEPMLIVSLVILLRTGNISNVPKYEATFSYNCNIVRLLNPGKLIKLQALMNFLQI